MDLESGGVQRATSKRLNNHADVGCTVLATDVAGLSGLGGHRRDEALGRPEALLTPREGAGSHLQVLRVPNLLTGLTGQVLWVQWLSHR